MQTKLGILQSLIRSKTLVEGVDGEDLLWVDLLGVILEKVGIFWRKIWERWFTELEDFEIFQELGFRKNKNAESKVKTKTMEKCYLIERTFKLVVHLWGHIRVILENLNGYETEGYWEDNY